MMNFKDRLKQSTHQRTVIGLRMKQGICALMMAVMILPIVLGFAIAKASAVLGLVTGVLEGGSTLMQEKAQFSFGFQKEQIAELNDEIKEIKAEKALNKTQEKEVEDESTRKPRRTNAEKRAHRLAQQTVTAEVVS